MLDRLSKKLKQCCMVAVLELLEALLGGRNCTVRIGIRWMAGKGWQDKGTSARHIVPSIEQSFVVKYLR